MHFLNFAACRFKSQTEFGIDWPWIFLNRLCRLESYRR